MWTGNSFLFSITNARSLADVNLKDFLPSKRIKMAMAIASGV
jgi:hypothetical protein